MITLLAFYAGYANAISAVAVTKVSLPPLTSGPIYFPPSPWRRCRSTAEA
jgi:hypothetical protein